MNTTASTHIVWVMVAMLFTAGTAVAAPPQVNGDLPQTSASGDPTTNLRTDNKSQQAADLLRRARQAMAENDTTAAESLIAQSEALGVEYNSFNLGDTPKKARRDLERKRSAAEPTKPSQLMSPFAGNKKPAPTSDPFAGRTNNIAPPLADSRGVTPLPRIENGTPSAMPTLLKAGASQAAPDRYASTEPSENDSAVPDFIAKGAAQRNSQAGSEIRVGTPVGPSNTLLESRRALAVGDIRRAASWVQQAKNQNIQYSPLDDTPQKVEAAIRKMQDQGTMDKNTEAFHRTYARNLIEQAEALLRYNDYEEAERLANLASAQQVTFSPLETKPQDLLARISAMRRMGNRGAANVPGANYEVTQAMGIADQKRAASSAVYDPANDPTRNMTVANDQADTRYSQRQPTLAQSRASAIPAPPAVMPETIDAPPSSGRSETASGSAMSLFQQGETALKAHDKEHAYQYFRQAALRMNELDPATAQKLQDHLQLLSAPTRSTAQAGGQSSNMLDETAARQQVLARQVAADLAHAEANVRATRETDPKGALSLLEESRKKVEAAGLEPAAREQLLRRVDRSITETKQFLDENRPRLELTDKNNRTRQDIQREGQTKQETQEKIAAYVNDFNRLRDEQRYEEAQVVAKRAVALDPENPITQQLAIEAKFLYRVMSNQDVASRKAEGFLDALAGVDESAVPFNDRNPYVMPDAKTWDVMSKSRAKLTQAERRRNRTEREMEIDKKLKTPVSLDFTNAPLSKVVDYLAKIAEINLYLDPKGLAEEGVTTDTPVTIEVRNEIMLKSALNLILQPLHLSYVVKDEVLKITSEQSKDNETYKVTYNVADLVIPIPNFQGGSTGLDNAYANAMGRIGFGGGNPSFASTGSPLAVVASRDGQNAKGVMPSNILAQATSPHGGGNVRGNGQQPAGFGPGGLGGGSQADFDSLIELITTTVKPTTWDNVGGPGSIAPFETNLSIVVSQTQDVHEEIVDLLEQLRRMQDLQVTIEVRFITLTDNFFERIGVDFDFNIHNNSKNQVAGFGQMVSPVNFGTDPVTEAVYDTSDSNRDKSAVVGTTAAGNSPSVYTADLDIPFTQNSFGLAVPQFGGFDATAGAQLGFAILSDIEAYFFINAAQGDKRTNVLQAPKVTLFNGQQASVSDTSQSPFVVSVIPVVGDFAAAQQPVIVVLSEGTFMTVQAVVSNDRRFVRLTVVPFFSRINPNVPTFTFSGSTTTTTDTTRDGVQTTPNDNTKKTDSASKTTSGVTVQLPTFSSVSVTTTVSVPDGGTVLLGGIKRLSEGRNEFGVPMLNKIPYLNRLFKNVGVGRETQSLMMMVTPRIIIQEEEEEKLGVISGD